MVTSSTPPTTLPKRCIFNDADLASFLSSPAKEELIKLITAMGQACSVLDSSNNFFEYDPEEPLVGLSPGLAAWVGALQGMKRWLDEIPPRDDVEVRFGNPAFKAWHERMTKRAPRILATVLNVTRECADAAKHPPQDYELHVLQECCQRGREAAATATDSDHPQQEYSPVVLEICAYLRDAFGHAVRLDYGTGHESSFQIVLLSLFKVGVFGKAPEQPTRRRLKAATLSVWHAYLNITRGLQRDYRLEPAGSHGVWGLDDYHCLPFFFGAHQLVPAGDAPREVLMKTRNHEQQQADQKYLYYGCIAFIQSLKTKAPFFETSPMLHDISQSLSSYQKVASGLLKLYQGEVLAKRPVVQHWVFGPLFPASWTPSRSSSNTTTEDQQQQLPDGNEPHQSLFRRPVEPTTTGLPPTRAPWAK